MGHPLRNALIIIKRNNRADGEAAVDCLLGSNPQEPFRKGEAQQVESYRPQDGGRVSTSPEDRQAMQIEVIPSTLRYNNHLNPHMMKDNWTEAEERLLFHLHDELGNKWAIIAAKLGGRYQDCLTRTDNSVKNHFFAKLRKSMRKINKIINDRYKKQLKEVKLNVLYKIIEASEERFKKSPLCTFETSKYSCCNALLIEPSRTRSSFSRMTPARNQSARSFKPSSRRYTISARITSASPSS